MGEIADMMLDGTMCAGCGEFLHDGDDGDGYPEYCAGCKPDDEPKQEAPRTFETPFFPIKNAATLGELGTFLSQHAFNDMQWGEDKRNNPLCRLFLQLGHGKQKIAIICVANKPMKDEVDAFLRARVES